MQQDALKKFIDKTMKEHKIKPDFLFVYRDGVAESQLDQVVSVSLWHVSHGINEE